MKLSLLDMVQDILSDMDSDEVNGIDDTQESLQVAQIVKSTYFELISRRDWPHLKELFKLESSGDNTKPTHTKIPSKIEEVRAINYNKRQLSDSKDKYEEVLYMSPEVFLTHTNARSSDASNVTTVEDFSGVTLFVVNDAGPQFWTSFDDEYIVFDSYDNEVDSTIQTSKTQCHGLRQPSWSMVDDFIPDLPIDAFPLLLAEAKSVAQFRLRGFQDQKAEQQATRQRFRMSRKSWKANSPSRYPNFGRKFNKTSIPPRG